MSNKSACQALSLSCTIFCTKHDYFFLFFEHTFSAINKKKIGLLYIIPQFDIQCTDKDDRLTSINKSTFLYRYIFMKKKVES